MLFIMIDAVFEGKIVSGELCVSSESRDVRFFDPESLPADLVPPSTAPLDDSLHGLWAVIR